MLMQRIARAVIRRRRVVLIVAAVAFPLCAAFGAPVASHLSAGGFAARHAESTRATARLAELFHTGEPNFVVLVTAKSGTVDDAAVAARGRALTEALGREHGVEGAASYWSLNNAPPLRGRDGRQALILSRIPGDDNEVRDVTGKLAPEFSKDDGVVSLGVGGSGEVWRAITDQSEKDLKRAELLTVPLTVIALLVVFGSAVAAGLPLGVAGVAVVVTYAALRLLGSMTEVSVFALNLTTAMSLGLAIDYSLFFLSRYREELADGREPEDAIARTMHTAGRTVAFSAFTVATSLGALLMFPLPFLRSFAYAGLAVVLTAAIGAVVVLPAFLAVIGRRVEKGRLWQDRKSVV